MTWRQHYPFDSHFCSIDGNRMHYVDEAGTGLGDEVLLMIHGNPTWSFYYRNIILKFRERIRCLAPDHLGMGFSDKPVDANYCLDAHLDRLCQWIEKLDLKKIHLMVHDWGGAIGLGAALQLPDRFERFTITNTAAFPPPYVPARISICRWPLIGPWLMKGWNVFPRAAIKMATEQKGGLEKSIAAGYVAPYDRWAHRVAVNAFVQDIPTRKNQATWKKLEEIESNLSSLDAKPVQLIWGMKDWCFRPECLERFHQHLPNASIVELSEAGHYLNEDALDAIVDAMSEFMEQSHS